MKTIMILAMILAAIASDVVAEEEGSGNQRMQQSKTKVKTPQPRKCFKCSGKGSVEVSVSEPCPNCDGTGVVVSMVEVKDTKQRLNYHYRTTRQAQNKQPCLRCGRRGKIPVKKDVECSICKGEGWLLNVKPYSRDD